MINVCLCEVIQKTIKIEKKCIIIQIISEIIINLVVVWVVMCWVSLIMVLSEFYIVYLVIYKIFEFI